MFTRKKLFVLVIAIFFLAILPFLRNINDSFLSDDWDFLSISANREKPIWSYFLTNYYGTHDGGVYRPMVNVFWAAGYAVFGLNPVGYHAATLFFHALSAVLLFLLLLRLPWGGERSRLLLAWVSTGFFLVFPNHAEAVNWIAVVNDTLLTVFYLASLLFFLFSFLASERKKQIIWYLLSLLSFLFALFTKEMAITLPIILSLFVFYHLLHRKLNRQQYLRALLFLTPYGVITLMYFGLRYFATGFFLRTYTGEVTLSAFQLWRSYLSMFFSHFLSDQVRTDVTMYVYHHRVAFLVIVLLVLAASIYGTYRKRGSFLPFVFASAFMVSIIPVFQYSVNLTPRYFSEEGERYAYLPSVFMAMVLGYIFTLFLRYFQNQKNWRMVVSAILILIWLSLSSQLLIKNKRWQEAAVVSQKTLENFIVNWRKQNLDGVVLVGLPDSYHGAYLFRNALPQALTLLYPGEVEMKQILVSANRTMYQSQEGFSVERISPSVFQYQVRSGLPLIVSEVKVQTHDYSSLLELSHIEPYTISHVFFGNQLQFTLSTEFVAENQKKSVGIWFFDAGEWQVWPLFST